MQTAEPEGKREGRPPGRGKKETPQTWLCVQPARVEELGGEVDVHVTEK